MSTEITRLAEGTRVIRRGGTVRGTVAGYYRDSLSVAIDGGGSDTAPAHFRGWRELTAEEAAEERGTVPTDAERQASLTAEQLRQPHGLEEAVAWLLDRGPRYDYISWGCEGCGQVAAADNAAELRELVEHAAYDHVARAGIVGIKAPSLTIHADRLAQWLGRSR